MHVELGAVVGVLAEHDAMGPSQRTTSLQRIIHAWRVRQCSRGQAHRMVAPASCSHPCAMRMGYHGVAPSLRGIAQEVFGIQNAMAELVAAERVPGTRKDIVSLDDHPSVPFYRLQHPLPDCLRKAAHNGIVVGQ